MKVNAAVILFLSAGLMLQISCRNTHVNPAVLNTPAQGSGDFTITSIVGYWASMDDGLIVHITGFEFSPRGQGSFLDVNGRLIHAGKFRDMTYKGGNQWECQQYVHSPGLVYPDDPNQIRWEYALLELLDRNTLRVGKTIYTRK